jgi:GNAT superfamily N-acetyltransferase
MSACHIETVENRAQLKQFIYLPAKLHAGYAMYVPPLYADEWAFFDASKNMVLSQCPHVLVLAKINNQNVGRIMVLLPTPYNQLHQENNARFYAFDCIEDPTVARLLLNFAQNWAKNQGAQYLIGPFGCSDKDPQGMQVEGFDQLPVLATPVNQAYLPTLTETQGFTRFFDVVSYQLPVQAQLPPLHQRVLRRAMNSQELELLHFTTTRQLKPFIVPVLSVMNSTYTDIYGFLPLTEADMQKLAKQYLPILNPRFVKIIINKNRQPVAFAIAMPDMSPGIQKAKGRLFPFGFIHILLAAKKTKQLNMMLGAVLPKYRGRGLTAVLGQSIMHEAYNKQFEYLDSHMVLESNTLMRAEYENLGGRIYKRFRVYQKKI